MGGASGDGEAVSQRVWPHPSMHLERWFSVDPQRQRVRGLVNKMNDADAFDLSFTLLSFCSLIGFLGLQDTSICKTTLFR